MDTTRATGIIMITFALVIWQIIPCKNATMYMYQSGIREMLTASDWFRLGSGLLRNTYVGSDFMRVLYDSDGVTAADMKKYG